MLATSAKGAEAHWIIGLGKGEASRSAGMYIVVKVVERIMLHVCKGSRSNGRVGTTGGTQDVPMLSMGQRWRGAYCQPDANCYQC